MSQQETIKNDALIQSVNDLENDAVRLIQYVLNHISGSDIVIASSYSAEDVVLIDLFSQQFPGITVLAIDTGRLPEETYQIAETINNRMNITLKWLFPAKEDVESLLQQQGNFGFKKNLEARHNCCGVRKVKVLRKGLEGYKAWATGQRREQSVTRSALKTAERETHFAPDLKINPLATWTQKQIWDHIKERGLPVHALYSGGYTSIGCAPCTRPITPGDHERAGRWWWEDPENKECGLHQSPHMGGTQ